MKRYQSIIVPIGLNDQDTPIIRWASKITHLAQTERVVFVHAMETPDLPDKAREKYPWLLDPLSEQIMQRMQDSVREYWKGHADTEIRYRTVEGNSDVLEVLRVIVEEDADMVIIGKESISADMAVRLARKAPCSVMSIPANADDKLERILVPTDFSQHCQNALDIAFAFAEAAGLESVDSLHIYNLGRFHDRIPIPDSELRAFEEEHANQRQLETLNAVVNRGIPVNFILHQANLIPEAIHSKARDLNTDLIIAGCRGRNTVASLLLGSNAEKLLKDAPVPVIASKLKGTGQTLLEALLNE